MDKYTGKRLDGRYEIQELLGIGGMARVYKAYDQIDDRTVAIKILKDEYLENQDFVRRFKNESKAIAVLSHSNIVKVYDVSFGDIIQYIVMEYINGITLKEYIDQQKEISWKETIHFTIQILQALEHAHAKGIVHRDIKPQNIMLLQDGTIKVTDFGIARFTQKETRTMTEKAMGSVHYISPEQARGDTTNEKADLYSVGVIMYEMLTGKLPFEADNAVSVAIMQLQVEPRPPKDINPAIPDGLQDITLKAMKKDQTQRYATATEMLESATAFKNDPSARFEYKYFIDDKPTKYVDAIDTVKSRQKKSNNYGDNFDYKKDQDSKESKSKWLSYMFGIGIGVLVIALGFVVYATVQYFSNSAGDVDIPNFIGMKLTDVQVNNRNKFKFETDVIYDPDKPEGVVTDQNPKPGSKKVKEGSRIMLKVNSVTAPVIIPTVKGMSEQEAKAKLKEKELNCEVLTVEDDETAKGIVTGTDPKESSEVVVKSTVKLFVSKGPAPKRVAVPNVINKNLSDAKSELISKGLGIAEKVTTTPSDLPKDTVISSDPAAGTQVTVGTAIQLTVSSGAPEIKSVQLEVPLPKGVTKTISITVFINGEEDLSKSKKLRPDYYPDNYSVTINDSKGKKQTVVVEIDGNKYRSYYINFEASALADKIKVTEFPYVPPAP